MTAGEEETEVERIVDLSKNNLQLVPPYRYSMVDNGIFRGAYPTLPNFRFLGRLQLKTILSLVPEPVTSDLKLFCEMASINSVHIPIERGISYADAQAPFTSALEDEFRSTIDRLIDSEDEYDVNQSHEEGKIHNGETKEFTNRFMDSQKIGFKLAEEIRKLRSDLAKERSENRLLRVTNENLQEQLTISEKRMEQFELKEINSSKKVHHLEEALKSEIQRCKALEEELRLFKHERKRNKREEEELIRNSKDIRHKFDDTTRQLIYWKECVTAYEVKIKELVHEKELQDHLLDESKRKILNLENFIFQIRSKVIRFHESCTHLLGVEGSLESLQQKSQSLLTTDYKLAEEEFQLLDSLFSFIKKRLQMYSESRKKYKDHIQKLMMVVKMYEEMVPTLECDV